MTNIGKECLIRRRRATRATTRAGLSEMERDVIVVDYREKRRELKKAILRAKINFWKQLQEDVDTDIWR